MGVDLRSSGSGNIGATNVSRTLGPWLGLITLVADVAKGAVPVFLARSALLDDRIVALVGLSTFFGHIFPIFARFRGGKGVATGAGVFLILSPAALGCAVAVFLIVVARFRIVSLASLSAGCALPLATALGGAFGPTRWAAVLVGVTLFGTHRDNLRRLADGTEPTIRSRRVRHK